MLWENRCLMLFPDDLVQLKKEVKQDVDLMVLLEKQFQLLGITVNDIDEIQAFSNNLVPYEKLILSMIELISPSS
ncbi:MAG: hypothetical protein APF76_04760 [Desulfitibacter sp. BRH_c19]|nr:MAG: hypothetical protein APF76_04760 [Desulfitibacter sp. BRH_c19]